MGLNDLPGDQADFIRRFILGSARLSRDLADRADGIDELRTGLAGLLGDSDPEAGTAAADLSRRIAAIAQERADLMARLADADELESLDEIAARIAEMDIAGRAVFDEVAQWAAAGAGLAATLNDPQAGAALAAARGLPGPADLPCPDPDIDGANYAWAVGPDGEPRIVPQGDDLPGCRHDADTGQYVFSLNRGWISDTEIARNWFANNPLPNSRYEYENGYVYETDDKGRTCRVSAPLQDDPWDRDLTIQTEAGHVGVRGNPKGKKEKYDGGHLIPRELGGAPGKLNLVPMQSDLNRTGEWRQMERMWRDHVVAGHEVEVDIEVEYYARGNADRRNTPRTFTVAMYVDGELHDVVSLRNTRTGR